MTTPDGTGSPDWQKPVQWRTQNLFTAISQTFAPGTTYTAYLVMQAWSSVLLRVQPSAGYGKVTVYWYATASAADFIGSDTWLVNSNTGLFVMLPVEGTYMVVGVDVTSSVDMTARTYLCGVNNGAGSIYYPITGNDVFETSVTLAASGAADYYLPFIRKGAANLYFDPYDTAAKLYALARVTDEAGAATGTFADTGLPTAPVNISLVCPGKPVAIHVANSDTAASHEFGLAFVTSD